MLKGKFVNTQFVEDEVIVDVKFVNAGAPRMMLIDSRAPKYVVSKDLIEGYLNDMKVSKDLDDALQAAVNSGTSMIYATDADTNENLWARLPVYFDQLVNHSTFDCGK